MALHAINAGKRVARPPYVLLLFLLLPLVADTHSGGGTIEFIHCAGQWPGPFLHKDEQPQSDMYPEPRSITYLIGAAAN